MAKLVFRLGHIAAEVKDFVDDRFSLARVRGAVTDALDVIFPPHGFEPHDDNPDRDGLMQSGIAAGAWSRIRFLADEGCDMCARPFQGGLHFGAGALCSACVDKPFPFSRTRAACLYTEASKDMILQFKHGDRLDLAPMLMRWLERAGADIFPAADALVPVPLHPSRLRQRRYNQACELARPLSRHVGCTFLPDTLKRTKATKQQSHSAELRWANVRTAFAVSKAGEKQVTGKHLVLIDDVFTTGATLRACANTLLKAGAKQVDAVVLARAVSQQQEL